MTDAGKAIQIDIQSAPISAFEQAQGAIRFNLGYISGEFSKNITIADLFVRIWFQRGLDMEWESVQFKLNNGRKVFRQKLPAGLTVTTFYAQLYGWVAPEENDLDLVAEFELTDFELSIKEIQVGKFAGEPLGLDTTSEPPPPPVIIPFEMELDVIADVQATQARAIFYTSHKGTTRVIYGLSPIGMTSEVNDLTFTQFHDIILPNLEVARLYYAQFFSISELTGEEIYSDVKSFFTSPELTITSFLGNPDVDFIIKAKQELAVMNSIGETDNLLTTDPDAEDDLILNSSFTTHNKIELAVTNLIGNNFDTLVT
jgi:hypothetical protein